MSADQKKVSKSSSAKYTKALQSARAHTRTHERIEADSDSNQTPSTKNNREKAQSKLTEQVTLDMMNQELPTERVV